MKKTDLFWQDGGAQMEVPVTPKIVIPKIL